MPIIAGGGQAFVNYRFASPTIHNEQHKGHLYPVDVFPFTYGDAKDPFTGRVDGILRRARASNTIPKVMQVDTSSEYWDRSASLVHTDPLGKTDARIPPEVRIYAIGGAQHRPGEGIPAKGGSATNPTDYRPVLRALLVALDRWVRNGAEPPPSRYPRIADGTLAGWRLRTRSAEPLLLCEVASLRSTSRSHLSFTPVASHGALWRRRVDRDQIKERES